MSGKRDAELDMIIFHPLRGHRGLCSVAAACQTEGIQIQLDTVLYQGECIGSDAVKYIVYNYNLMTISTHASQCPFFSPFPVAASKSA